MSEVSGAQELTLSQRQVRLIGTGCVVLMFGTPLLVGVLTHSFLLAMVTLGGFGILFPTLAGVLAVVAARRERQGKPDLTVTR